MMRECTDAAADDGGGERARAMLVVVLIVPFLVAVGCNMSKIMQMQQIVERKKIC